MKLPNWFSLVAREAFRADFALSLSLVLYIPYRVLLPSTGFRERARATLLTGLAGLRPGTYNSNAQSVSQVQAASSPKLGYSVTRVYNLNNLRKSRIGFYFVYFYFFSFFLFCRVRKDEIESISCAGILRFHHGDSEMEDWWLQDYVDFTVHATNPAEKARLIACWIEREKARARARKL